jgi:hypothetical protein
MITWGQLAKSQTDPEKIEEAIARMIAEHDADPEAHLCEGGSLKSHKMAEIIDHLVSSIIADKLSAIQKMYLTDFEALDGYMVDRSGGYAEIIWPGLNLKTGFQANNWVRVRSSVDIGNMIDFSKNPFFQVQVALTHLTDCIAWWRRGFAEPDEDSLSFGFKVIDGGLYAEIVIGENSYTSEITGVDVSEINVYRAEIQSDLKKGKFYVNGILKAEITYTESPEPKPFVIDFYHKTLNNVAKTLLIQHLMLAND